MKKSGKFSEELCDLLVNRIHHGYSNSDTLEGKIDGLTDILLDILMMLKEKKVFRKKDLVKLGKRYRKWD